MMTYVLLFISLTINLGRFIWLYTATIIVSKWEWYSCWSIEWVNSHSNFVNEEEAQRQKKSVWLSIDKPAWSRSHSSKDYFEWNHFTLQPSSADVLYVYVCCTWCVTLCCEITCSSSSTGGSGCSNSNNNSPKNGGGNSMFLIVTNRSSNCLCIPKVSKKYACLCILIIHHVQFK